MIFNDNLAALQNALHPDNLVRKITFFVAVDIDKTIQHSPKARQTIPFAHVQCILGIHPTLHVTGLFETTFYAT